MPVAGASCRHYSVLSAARLDSGRGVLHFCAMLWRLRAFPDFCEPCLPSPVDHPPAGGDWIHEIKHDGFRLLARRGTLGVRLFTRNGHDWTERFPLIFEALAALKVATCLIDGEAVTCTEAGLADFDGLRNRRGDVHLCAFDLLELDGRDLRLNPLTDRRRLLAKLLRKARAGLLLNAQFEEDGPLVFQHACLLGCEGIVSKRKNSRYRSGRSRDWVKMKNPAAPALRREAEEDWGRRRWR
jgi:bifunctional non-homologous end joining protein LigD